MIERQGFQERISRIEGLVHQLETSADPASRSTATELVQSLMDLHGAGFERLLEIVAETAGERSAAVIDRLGRDSLVSSLLVLYELHPEDLDSRVRRGVEHLSSFLRSQGATVEVLAVGEGTVRLRVEKQTNGCASTAATVRTAVEEAIAEFAPDTVNLIIEGVEQQIAASGFVPLHVLADSARSLVAAEAK